MLPDTWSVLIDGSGSVVLAQAEGQMIAQGSSLALGCWPCRDLLLPGAVSWAEAEGEGAVQPPPAPQPSPWLSNLGALFSDGKSDGVGQECTAEAASSCDPGWLHHRDVSMLKPTAKHSSLSQSLLDLCPTLRLSSGGLTGSAAQAQQRCTVRVWWHKMPSRETLQALVIHATVALQCPPSDPSIAAPDTVTAVSSSEESTSAAG